MTDTTELETAINNLSLLVVMVDPHDKMGIETLQMLCQKCIQIVENDPNYSRIVDCLQRSEEILSNNSAADYLRFVEEMTKAAQQFMSDPDGAVFPCEEGQNQNNDCEFGAHYDEEFLPEFIEKHSLLLDEMEGAALQLQYSGANITEAKANNFEKYVRSYLHNIKGDAGAIGISGIERVTHDLEDLLLEHKPHTVVSTLLLYKEWVMSCFNSFIAAQAPLENSTQIIARLHASVDMSTSEAQSESSLHVNDLGESALAHIPAHIPANGHANGVESATSVSVYTTNASDTSSTDDVDEEIVGEDYQIMAEPSLFAEFAAEAEDHLNEIERVLLEEGEAASSDGIDKVFRGVHSLKGASSFFNLKEINETSHVLENILDQVRQGVRKLEQDLIQIVFHYVDLQKKLIVRARTAVETQGISKTMRQSVQFLGMVNAYTSGNYDKAEFAKAEAKAEISNQQKAISDCSAGARKDAHTGTVAESSSAKAAFPVSATVVDAPAQHQPQAKQQKPSESLDVKTFIKIDTERLDGLIDSIGEMVIYSSILVRKCRELLSGHEAVIKTSHQVEKFSRELQEIGMSMRLDPIKGLFQKMSRLIWDVSKKLKKEITFSMKGEDTELDRTVIERLADPLMHMVRNAIDHGIEPPDEREAMGKSRKGLIELHAYHDGGSIKLIIRDDGRGLDKQKLRAKAVEKGIIAEGDIMTDSEVYNLIFAPGFSTADKVTDISGRGVGMDVVRNNILSMRGHVNIESTLGKGSTFTIELPLTLAIIDGVEALVGVEKFIIPTLSILELIKPTPEMICSTIGECDTFQFRGRFLTLFDLNRLYKMEGDSSARKERIVVVVENGGEQIALLVDDILGSCQTVIKSLGTMFNDRVGLAGCAIMPNGDIGLILDVRSLVELARDKYVFAGKVDRAEMADRLFEVC